MKNTQKYLSFTFDSQIPMILEQSNSLNFIKYCTGNAENDQDEEQH